MGNEFLGGIVFQIIMLICFVPMAWILFIGPLIDGISDIVETIRRRKANKKTIDFWEGKDDKNNNA